MRKALDDETMQRVANTTVALERFYTAMAQVFYNLAAENPELMTVQDAFRWRVRRIQGFVRSLDQALTQGRWTRVCHLVDAFNNFVCTPRSGFYVMHWQKPTGESMVSVTYPDETTRWFSMDTLASIPEMDGVREDPKGWISMWEASGLIYSSEAHGLTVARNKEN